MSAAEAMGVTAVIVMFSGIVTAIAAGEQLPVKWERNRWQDTVMVLAVAPLVLGPVLGIIAAWMGVTE